MTQRTFETTDEASGSVLPVTVQDAVGYNSWSFVQTIGNTLICAYSRGMQHSITETCRGVYARISKDGGHTWQPESTVVNTVDECESAIGKGLDEKGAMLLWVRCIGEKRWHHDLYRSVDGISFERIATLEPSPMPMQITDVFAVEGVGLMSLWFSGRYKDLPENSWGTLVSRDNGLTWEQTTIENGLMKGDWPTEPSCVSLGDGRLFVVARAERRGDGEPSRQFQLQSDDKGKTWRKFRTNIDDVSESTPSLILGKDGKIWNYYYQRGAGLLKRRVVNVFDVWDNPMNWPEPENVCKGSENAHHAGNVNACVYGDRHACTFYSGDERQTDVKLVLAETSCN
ncbi:MAG: exo-alpha-sialidase [Victivallales bacterium]|nr:exo-alpha-sialidase [Victivallales bacterium]